MDLQTQLFLHKKAQEELKIVQNEEIKRLVKYGNLTLGNFPILEFLGLDPKWIFQYKKESKDSEYTTVRCKLLWGGYSPSENILYIRGSWRDDNKSGFYHMRINDRLIKSKKWSYPEIAQYIELDMTPKIIIEYHLPADIKDLYGERYSTKCPMCGGDRAYYYCHFCGEFNSCIKCIEECLKCKKYKCIHCHNNGKCSCE